MADDSCPCEQTACLCDEIGNLKEALSQAKADLAKANTQWDMANQRATKATELRHAAEALAKEQERVIAEMRGALKLAEHELITLHNLDASDDPERLFRNPFTIDTGIAQKAVRKALTPEPAKEKS